MSKRRWLMRGVLPVVLVLIAVLSGLLLTEPGRKLMTTILSRLHPETQVAYICPLAERSNVVETAACQDCTYYPVDKTHGLPATYVPKLVDSGLPGGRQVAEIARPALEALFTEAIRQGFSPVVSSAYRSFEEQDAVFRGWVLDEWQRTQNLFLALANAQRYSALPGHSEHQLGTAIDVNCQTCVPFDTGDSNNVALWNFLQMNAHRFGFVISYPPAMEDRTGYLSEPWHIRYIGVDLATELYNQGYLTGNGVCELTFLRLKMLN